jgi:hypothetical protein
MKQKLNNSNSASPSSNTPNFNIQPTTPQQSGGMNINSVKTILKKLGVNVASAQSPLSSLISNIGQGTKTVNNGVVNISLNVLKDINIDEMIDDDDGEERKFLIKELEKKANTKKSHAAIQNDTEEIPLHTSGVKRSRSNSSTNNRLLSSPNVTIEYHN